MRFNELRRGMDGVSQRMLSLTLKGLERDGLVRRTIDPTVPPRVDYALTDLGRTLHRPLEMLAAWVRESRPAIDAARRRFADGRGPNVGDVAAIAPAPGAAG